MQVSSRVAEGFLGFVLRWGEVKLPPCLKLVRMMLETLNLARKYNPYVILGNIPFSA